MIRKIQIQGYRSCLDTTLELHPYLSVLIGPNSSGKTNLLNALLLLRKLTVEDEYLGRFDQETTGQSKLKVWFEIGGKKIIFTATVYIYTDENNNDIVVQSEQHWYAKDFTGSGKWIYTPLSLIQELGEGGGYERLIRYTPRRRYLFYHEERFKIPEPLIKPFREIARELSELRYYGASQFTSPADCPVSIEIEKERGRRRTIPRLRGHAKFLNDIYISSKSPKKSNYDRFFEIVGPRGIGLVDNIEFKEISRSSIDIRVRSGGRITKRNIEKILVIPQFQIGNNNLSPNQLSEGTFKTITLLYYLITEESKILLIEEPEVCVHHGLLASLIELIKTYSAEKQIVVTTHSDFVLDKVRPDNVYKVTNSPEGGTKVHHITKSMSSRELSALKEYLDTEGNLGEYWRHGGLEE